ncbi:MAG: hypothetical protein H6837_15925 [Planctomycetes bacterium]|nr:hypothetical protein [Planctomycetota bacterium]
MAQLRTTFAFSLLLCTASLSAQTGGTKEKPTTPPTGTEVVPGSPGHVAEGGSERPTRIVTGTPNSWFDRTRLSLGTVSNEKTVTGRFTFRNPTGKTVRFTGVRGACDCASAVLVVGNQRFEAPAKPKGKLYRIELGDAASGKPAKRTEVTFLDVPAGGTGYVVTETKVENLEGPLSSSLEITTTDPGMPQVMLVWAVTGVRKFLITPPELRLGKLRWDETRSFQFRVQSKLRPEFHLTRPQELPHYVTLTRFERVVEAGKPSWLIEGSFGPNADPRAGGTILTVTTDHREELQLKILAEISVGVTVKPGTFLSLGRIDRAKGRTFDITLTAPKVPMKLVRWHFNRLSIDQKFVKVTSKRTGDDLVVSVTIAPNAEGKLLLRGELQLSLDHPAMRECKIGFNGILR